MEPLVPLLGSWTGRGRGDYPTVKPFDYDETITFTHVGKPFFEYQDRTWNPADHRPLHTEKGYWRLRDPEWVEMVMAYPSGIVEIAEGPLLPAPTRIELKSVTMAGTSTAKSVTAVERDFVLDDDTLRYVMRMAAVGEGMGFHCEGELKRVSSS